MDTLLHLDPLLRTFWFVAIPASVIFIIQAVMTFVGIESEGLDVDMDGGLDAETPFQLFSLRNLINFLLGFSWTGISLYGVVSGKGLLLAISIAAGSLFVYCFFLIIRQVQKLAENNSFQLAHTLNKSAQVYLSIPEKKSGRGKIMISVNGSFHELDAMTEHERIPSGAAVKVVRIEGGNVLIVETI